MVDLRIPRHDEPLKDDVLKRTLAFVDLAIEGVEPPILYLPDKEPETAFCAGILVGAAHVLRDHHPGKSARDVAEVLADHAYVIAKISRTRSSSS